MKTRPGLRPEQTIYEFDNGYGASVLSGSLFYTSEEKPYELAVIKFGSSWHWEIDYTTPITNDVLGYLNQEELDATIVAIGELPRDNS